MILKFFYETWQPKFLSGCARMLILASPAATGNLIFEQKVPG